MLDGPKSWPQPPAGDRGHRNDPEPARVFVTPALDNGLDELRISGVQDLGGARRSRSRRSVSICASRAQAGARCRAERGDLVMHATPGFGERMADDRGRLLLGGFRDRLPFLDAFLFDLADQGVGMSIDLDIAAS